MDKKLLEAIDYAVRRAIAEVGLDGFKATSMFMSNRKGNW